MRRILLIEPPYRNKYPPLGLMKISAYHKLLGDTVVFSKGNNPLLRSDNWDRVYITTLFTFAWNTTAKTIRYYLKSVNDPCNIFVGGPMASIMPDALRSLKGFSNITIIHGLLDKPGMLDANEHVVDNMTPDYSIVDQSQNEHLNYSYPVRDTYFVHTTRGCVRKCEFCAVPQIESKFKGYIDIKTRINAVIEEHGSMCNLMVMDNNILASPHLEQIVDDIVACGFGVDNNEYVYMINGKRKTKKRYVDFNQGLDARFLYANPNKMKILSRVAVKPLRIAFDYADDEFIKIYTKCIWLAAEHKIKDVSNYIMFNYNDAPNDLYKRLEINVLLNSQFEKKELRTRIWSFPMRYSPIFGEESKGRKYLGGNWTRKQLRAIQCILNVSHGVVGPKHSFFYRAFGENLDAFNRILWMPERYIIYRSEHENNKNTIRWKALYEKLDKKSLVEFHDFISDNNFNGKESEHPIIKKLLKHYLNIR
jgi:hypothetical protein